MFSKQVTFRLTVLRANKTYSFFRVFPLVRCLFRERQLIEMSFFAYFSGERDGGLGMFPAGVGPFGGVGA